MPITETIQKCKTILEGYYGARFKGLILYGSVARGQASPASDIDLLVLSNQPFSYLDELRQIIELLYPIQLESDQLISAKPAPWTNSSAAASNCIETRKEKECWCDPRSVRVLTDWGENGILDSG